jgi:hypothetical protein
MIFSVDWRVPKSYFLSIFSNDFSEHAELPIPSAIVSDITSKLLTFKFHRLH